MHTQAHTPGFCGIVAPKAYQSGGGQQQARIMRDVCPRCKAPKSKKNGPMHHGKQHQHCHGWGRPFVQCGEPYLMAEAKRGLIERLLVERMSLRGICRAGGVPLKWL